MPQKSTQPAASAPRRAKRSLRKRGAEAVARAWRPAASFVVLAMALAIGWHVVNGNNGLTNWQQKRAEDRRLRHDIEELERENASLRVHVQRLNGDEQTIQHEIREKLQYVGQDEVIFKLPPMSEAAKAQSPK